MKKTIKSESKTHKPFVAPKVESKNSLKKVTAIISKPLG